MKILSIDVGIKNLAICLINLNNDNHNDYKIEILKIINLFDEKIKKCEIQIFDKKNNHSICNKEAKFYKNNSFYCKSHASKNDEFMLPTSDFLKYKRMNIDQLKKIALDYNIKYDKNTKTNLIENIEKYIKDKVFENIGNTKCSEISIIELGIKLKIELDKELANIIDKIDLVLIENQISTIANRMNNIQGMVTQYFIMNNLTKINYVSPINKLKKYMNNNKITYNERKKLSIEISKKKLLEITNDSIEKQKIIEYFNNSKKKDDLADSFLQALWYIENL